MTEDDGTRAMALPKTCIMAVYFGPLPAWFPLWLASCAANREIDFLVVTDQKVDGAPSNVTVLSETLAGVKTRLEKALGVPVVLERPYKMCDYKPFLGLAFSDELAGCDYWGFTDIDLINGDLASFMRRLELWRYDKFLPLGHMFLFRNTPEVNERVKLPLHGREIWRDVVGSEKNMAFDEFGINEIYAAHGYPAYMGHPMADIARGQERFTLGFRFEARDGTYKQHTLGRYPNHRHQAFYWRDGKTGRLFIAHGNVVKEEFMYIHFQKRHFPPEAVHVKPGENFYLGSNGFVPMNGLAAMDAIRQANPYNPVAELAEKTKLYVHRIGGAVRRGIHPTE